MEEPASSILGEGIAGFRFLNGRVGMADNGRRDKNGSTGREVDDEPEIPQDNLSTSTEVKLAEGGDGAPSKRKVTEVCVAKSDRPWAKVKRCSRPRAFPEVLLEVGIGSVKLAKFDDVVCEEVWGEDIECSCGRGCGLGKYLAYADQHLLDVNPAKRWMDTLARRDASAKALMVVLSRLPAA
jgi:hypothetical protein